MLSKEMFEKLAQVAQNPKIVKDRYLSEGRKIILMAPMYAPEELVASFGMVPMSAWGADTEIKEAKKYFPAFICGIVQTAVECGMRGDYDGASAIIIPSLCDSLKVMGQNWKYAVPSIEFIPMTFPQNRKPAYARDYTMAGYKTIIARLEEISGKTFDEKALAETMAVYKEHRELMREVSEEIAAHPEVSAVERSAVFKSAMFMDKKEHLECLKELLSALKAETPEKADKIRIVTTGILVDNPSLLKMIDENNLQIVADDVAAESRIYRVKSATQQTVEGLAGEFSDRDNDTLLYDPSKSRIQMIVDLAKTHNAKGVLMVLTKFCDPEEFDYPFIKRACDAAGLTMIQIEVDRQMTNYEQARTMLESFKEMCEE